MDGAWTITNKQRKNNNNKRQEKKENIRKDICAHQHFPWVDSLCKNGTARSAIT